MTGDIISQLGGRHSIEKALSENLNWIVKSFARNKNLGSSGWSNILGQFSDPYPETTGYLIPTLLTASHYTGNVLLLSVAKKQIGFFNSIQNIDGSYYQSLKNKSPIVFDTSQILLGLCSIYHHEPDSYVLDQINSSLNWLNSLLDERGFFSAYNFTEKNCPAYYTRVFWAMIRAHHIVGTTPNHLIFNGIDSILKQINSNNSFSQWGFDNETFVLSHNIIYTLRGLYEIALLTDDKEMLSTTISCIDSIVSKIIDNDKFYGAYDQTWNPDRSFVCSVGNAQLAYLLISLDVNKYTKAIKIVLQDLLQNQSRIGPNKGAIPSSLPIWGRYQRWRYTNWTQKFFCDALLLLLK